MNADVREIALRIQRCCAALAARGDRLAVAVIAYVTRREYAGNVRRRAAGLLQKVSVFIEVEHAFERCRIRRVAGQQQR